MKTAIQQLVDIMNEDQVSFTEWFQDNYQIYIEKEKEQIIDARNSKEIEAIQSWNFATDIMSKGISNIPNNNGRTAEEYYNQTYNR